MKTFPAVGYLTYICECLAHIIKHSIDFSGLTTRPNKLVKGCKPVTYVLCGHLLEKG